MLPAVMALEAQVDLDERPPLGSLGFSDQVHAGFAWGPIALARIALDARTNNVLPNGRAPAVAGDDVVQVQILSVKGSTAVLAGVFVPFEDVVPSKFDLLFGVAVKKEKKDDPRHPNSERNGADTLRVRLLLRKVLPLVKTEGLEGTVAAGQDDLSSAFEQQG
jgi:hypothetical protein